MGKPEGSKENTTSLQAGARGYAIRSLASDRLGSASSHATCRCSCRFRPRTPPATVCPLLLSSGRLACRSTLKEPPVTKLISVLASALICAPLITWSAVAQAGGCPPCQTSADCPGGFCVVWDDGHGCTPAVNPICCPGQGCAIDGQGRPSCEAEGFCCVVEDSGCMAPTSSSTGSGSSTGSSGGGGTGTAGPGTAAGAGGSSGDGGGGGAGNAGDDGGCACRAGHGQPGAPGWLALAFTGLLSIRSHRRKRGKTVIGACGVAREDA
jgi:MYXO-CTERM domain-containing protein